MGYCLWLRSLPYFTRWVLVGWFLQSKMLFHHRKLTNVACTVLHSFVSTQTSNLSSAHFRNCVITVHVRKRADLPQFWEYSPSTSESRARFGGWSGWVWIFLRVLWFSLSKKHHFIWSSSSWSSSQQWLVESTLCLTLQGLRPLNNYPCVLYNHHLFSVWIINWGDNVSWPS